MEDNQSSLIAGLNVLRILLEKKFADSYKIDMNHVVELIQSKIGSQITIGFDEDSEGSENNDFDIFSRHVSRRQFIKMRKRIGILQKNLEASESKIHEQSVLISKFENFIENDFELLKSHSSSMAASLETLKLDLVKDKSDRVEEMDQIKQVFENSVQKKLDEHLRKAIPDELLSTAFINKKNLNEIRIISETNIKNAELPNINNNSDHELNRNDIINDSSSVTNSVSHQKLHSLSPRSLVTENKLLTDDLHPDHTALPGINATRLCFEDLHERFLTIRQDIDSILGSKSANQARDEIRSLVSKSIADWVSQGGLRDALATIGSDGSDLVDTVSQLNQKVDVELMYALDLKLGRDQLEHDITNLLSSSSSIKDVLTKLFGNKRFISSPTNSSGVASSAHRYRRFRENPTSPKPSNAMLTNVENDNNHKVGEEVTISSLTVEVKEEEALVEDDEELAGVLMDEEVLKETIVVLEGKLMGEIASLKSELENKIREETRDIQIKANRNLDAVQEDISNVRKTIQMRIDSLRTSHDELEHRVKSLEVRQSEEDSLLAIAGQSNQGNDISAIQRLQARQFATEAKMRTFEDRLFEMVTSAKEEMKQEFDTALEIQIHPLITQTSNLINNYKIQNPKTQNYQMMPSEEHAHEPPSINSIPFSSHSSIIQQPSTPRASTNTGINIRRQSAIVHAATASNPTGVLFKGGTHLRRLSSPNLGQGIKFGDIYAETLRSSPLRNIQNFNDLNEENDNFVFNHRHLKTTTSDIRHQPVSSPAFPSKMASNETYLPNRSAGLDSPNRIGDRRNMQNNLLDGQDQLSNNFTSYTNKVNNQQSPTEFLYLESSGNINGGAKNTSSSPPTQFVGAANLAILRRIGEFNFENPTSSSMEGMSQLSPGITFSHQDTKHSRKSNGPHAAGYSRTLESDPTSLLATSGSRRSRSIASSIMRDTAARAGSAEIASIESLTTRALAGKLAVGGLSSLSSAAIKSEKDKAHLESLQTYLQSFTSSTVPPPVVVAEQETGDATLKMKSRPKASRSQRKTKLRQNIASDYPELRTDISFNDIVSDSTSLDGDDSEDFDKDAANRAETPPMVVKGHGMTTPSSTYSPPRTQSSQRRLQQVDSSTPRRLSNKNLLLSVGNNIIASIDSAEVPETDWHTDSASSPLKKKITYQDATQFRAEIATAALPRSLQNALNK